MIPPKEAEQDAEKRQASEKGSRKNKDTKKDQHQKKDSKKIRGKNEYPWREVGENPGVHTAEHTADSERELPFEAGALKLEP